MAYRANLCGVDGSRAGCGPCVRRAGHAVGSGEHHRDERRAGFVVVERCPFCEVLAEEGDEMAAHVRADHGGAVAGEQLALGEVC